VIQEHNVDILQIRHCERLCCVRAATRNVEVRFSL
jgi:hypothetical protein